MDVVLELLAIIAFLVGLVCLVRPIQAIRIPTRRRAAAVMGVAFVALIIAAPMTDLPEVPEQISTQNEAKTPEPVPEPVANAPEPTLARDWNAHKFEVVTDEDISSSSRIRRRVVIRSAAAITREDRIATLIDAGRKSWLEHKSQFIALFLLPFDMAPDAVARIDYAPDKCGISGEGRDCTDRVWTNAYASDVIFTPRQQQIIVAWRTHQNRFKELDKDFGFTTINEGRLKEFLAEQFVTDTGEITSAMHQSIASVFRKEMAIPDHLERLGHLSDEEKKEADEIACRASLQCWGDKHSMRATVACRPLIESLARYDYKWTVGWLGAKLERFSWKDRKEGSISYTGNKIKFQNGFGAWQNMTYWCHYTPKTGYAEVSVH